MKLPAQGNPHCDDGCFFVAFFFVDGENRYERFYSPIAASDAAEAWSEATNGTAEVSLQPYGVLRVFKAGLMKRTRKDGLGSFVRGQQALTDFSERLDELVEVYGVPDDDTFF